MDVYTQLNQLMGHLADRLPAAKRDLVTHYIRQSEPGTAFERLTWTIGTLDLALDEADYQTLDDVGRALGYDPAEWATLRPGRSGTREHALPDPPPSFTTEVLNKDILRIECTPSYGHSLAIILSSYAQSTPEERRKYNIDVDEEDVNAMLDALQPALNDRLQAYLEWRRQFYLDASSRP